MKKWVRRKMLLESLRGKQNVLVEELAMQFKTSPSTIRRDLCVLEKEEMVIRSHGGVTLSMGFTILMSHFDERMVENAKEKRNIAKTICNYLPDGSRILLDNGTTCYHIAQILAKRNNLMVATNSIKIATLLGRSEKVDVLLAGGDYRERNYDCIGPKAVEFFANMSFDYAVLGADLILPEKGFYKFSCHSADIGNALKNAAKNVFIAADHSKLNNPANFRIAASNEVDILFMDSNIRDIELELLQKDPFQIVLC